MDSVHLFVTPKVNIKNVTFRINWHISPPQKELYRGAPKRLDMNVCQISPKEFGQIIPKVSVKASWKIRAIYTLLI